MAGAEGNGIGSLQITENNVLSHGVDLFEHMKIDKCLRSGQEVFYRPVSSHGDGPFTFVLPSQGDQYVQLGTFKLYGKTSIERVDQVATKDEIGVVNMFPASLFESIEVQLNNNVISEAGVRAAHYMTMIETLLTYGVDARNGHLDSAMFDLSDAGDFDNPTRDTAYKRLLTRVEHGKLFDWEIPVNSDFLRSDRFLPPKHDLTITFNRSRVEFSLLGVEGIEYTAYRVVFHDLKLYVRMLDADPAVLTFHMNNWRNHPFKFPINRTVIKNYLIPANNSYHEVGPIFTKHLPKNVVIGMVDTDAYQGSLVKNPWNFQHYNVKKMNIRAMNHCIPHDPYTPNFKLDLFAREYNGLFQNTGLKISNEGNCITRNLFKDGCFLMAFDLTPDQCNGFHAHPTQEGDLRVEIEFYEPLPQSVTMIIYSVFDSSLDIDYDRHMTVSSIT
jgi:hypothetical protein